MTMLAVEPRARAASRPLLSNPVASDTFIGIEQFAILVEREAVGHPGDIIGDHARQRLAIELDSAQHMPGHLARLAHIGLEQALEHPARFAGHPANPVMAI